MGAGCCRARIFPGGYGGPGSPGGIHSASIADLRPGSKFHFSREPFIRQHLVIAEKPLRHSGLNNPAFTEDVDPALRTPQVGPASITPAAFLDKAPVPPPRKKRRPRPNAPPLPPARVGRGGAERAASGSDSSILSPTHTMELLQRMSRHDFQRVHLEAAERTRARAAATTPRSLDSSLERKDSSVSLPGNMRQVPQESRLFEQSFAASSHHTGSWGMDLSKAGTDVEDSCLFASARQQVQQQERACFSLQSWEERARRLHGDDLSPSTSPPRSPPNTPTHTRSSSTPVRLNGVPNSALLLSPKKWRPVSLDTADTSGGELSARQTATRRAMSDFIVDTYGAQDHPAATPSGRGTHLTAGAAEEDSSEAHHHNGEAETHQSSEELPETQTRGSEESDHSSPAAPASHQQSEAVRKEGSSPIGHPLELGREDSPNIVRAAAAPPPAMEDSRDPAPAAEDAVHSSALPPPAAMDAVHDTPVLPPAAKDAVHDTPVLPPAAKDAVHDTPVLPPAAKDAVHDTPVLPPAAKDAVHDTPVPPAAASVQDLQDDPHAPRGRHRRASAASTESLGDLEEDIYQMLSAGKEDEEELSSAELVLRQQKQYLQRLGERLVQPPNSS